MTDRPDPLTPEQRHRLATATTAWLTNRPSAVAWRLESHSDGRVRLAAHWTNHQGNECVMRFAFTRETFATFADLVLAGLAGMDAANVRAAGDAD